MKKAIKGIFNTVIDILVVLVLIISILTVILSLSSKSAGVANIFGYVPLSVQSGSMEPTFYQNDLIFCKHIEDKAYSYKVDDIVTFPMEVDGVRILNTHRIIEVIEDTVPVYGVDVCVRTDKKPVSVRLQPGGEELPFTYGAGAVRYTVPRVDIHCMTVIEF